MCVCGGSDDHGGDVDGLVVVAGEDGTDVLKVTVGNQARDGMRVA